MWSKLYAIVSFFSLPLSRFLFHSVLLSFNRENMPSHFKVKEYCPLVFRNLRERFGVDDVDYRESLTRSQPVQIDSSGKSGAQFYRSYDKYFILKSLTSEEIERMHAFLKHYHPVSAMICLMMGFFFGLWNSFVLFFHFVVCGWTTW